VELAVRALGDDLVHDLLRWVLTSSVRYPRRANPAHRFTAVVVLPTPFWFAMVTITYIGLLLRRTTS